jgi:hypothetical protein
MQDFFRRLWGSAPHGSIHTPRFYIPDKEWGEFGWVNRLPQDLEVTEWDIKRDCDVYFAPVMFKGARLKENALPTHWCWADLDLADPNDMEPRPTIAWESSPGRWHAMWEMNEEIPAADAAHMSKRIAYHVGADKSGWDITQVLRVPGTHNHKYPGPPAVKLLWHDSLVWTLAELSRICPEVEREKPEEEIEFSDESPLAILGRFNISKRAQDLLNVQKEQPQGERSKRLFELENLLAEAGMDTSEIIVVTRASVWNKFVGRTDELLRLASGARKASAKHQRTPYFDKRVKWQHEIMARQPVDAGWLIKDIWHAGTWGIVGGEAKSFKSMITLEMAQAVASGEPFLGEFEVHRQGPVLVIQEENDEDYYLPDLLHKITRARGLLPKPAIWQEGPDAVLAPAPMLPIAYLNQTGFTFQDPECMSRVEELVKDIQPILVVFDPLYSMLGGLDETKAHEIRPALNWLRELAVDNNTAVALCNHWRKKQGKNDHSRAGQRLSGSNNFHNWIVSALYVERMSDDDPTVVVQREFRRAMLGKLIVKFDIGEFGDPDAYTTSVGLATNKG